MVMQEENQLQNDQQLGFTDITPLEEPAPEIGETLEAVVEETASTTGSTETATEITEQQPTPVEQAPVPDSPPEKTPEQVEAELQRQRDLDELSNRRMQEDENKRKQSLLQRAKQHEQQLLEEGLMPETARKQTRQMIEYENKLYDQDKQAMQLLHFAEGRNIAALQIGMKHGLIPKEVVDDINILLRSQSPNEMEYEAGRMKELRQTRAEISQLKQGQVKPQTFDNSQGSAEAVNNEDRLIDAYLNGDRSEAAVQAAKRLTFGS